MFDFDEWVRSLHVVGDQAYSPDDAAERRRASEREYRKRPDVRERRAAYQREWADRNRERARKISRESARRRRQDPAYREAELERERIRRAHRDRSRVSGSLHDLACTGPTRATGCVCKKIKVYVVERAA